MSFYRIAPGAKRPKFFPMPENTSLEPTNIVMLDKKMYFGYQQDNDVPDSPYFPAIVATIATDGTITDDFVVNGHPVSQIVSLFSIVKTPARKFGRSILLADSTLAPYPDIARFSMSDLKAGCFLIFTPIPSRTRRSTTTSTWRICMTRRSSEYRRTTTAFPATSIRLSRKALKS